MKESIMVELDEATVGALKAIAEKDGVTVQEVVDRMIRNATLVADKQA